MIDGQACSLDILDTAGQDDCINSTKDQYMRNGQGFMCVYDITERSTFDEIAVIKEQILRVKEKDRVPMVLVGNKFDLGFKRQVTSAEGQELAKNFSCLFLECSAKTIECGRSIHYNSSRDSQRKRKFKCKKRNIRLQYSVNERDNDCTVVKIKKEISRIFSRKFYF